MTATYKVSFMRAGGWSRLGLAGAVAVLFLTPMLWSVGAFGPGDEALHRALVFALAGVWFFVGTFYMIGWALKGFMLRVRDAEEGEDLPHRPQQPLHPVAHAPTGAPQPPRNRPVGH